MTREEEYRKTLITSALGLVIVCPHSESRHKDCYLEYIRKGRTNVEMFEYLKTMTNRQLERLISHHNECPIIKEN